MSNRNKRKLLLVIWAGASLFTLLACQTFTGGSTVELTPTVMVVESDASESADPAIDAAPTPTPEAVQPTEEAAESEPESTPEGEESAKSDASDETDSDMSSSAPAAGGWGESQTMAQTACDNPYFPLRLGANWTFEDSDGFTSIWRVTEVNGDLNSATATVEIEVVNEGFALTYHWECEPGGKMVSYDYAALSNAGGSDVATVKVLEASGEFLPGWENLQPGLTWEINASSVMSLTVEGFEGMMAGDMQQAQVHKVVGLEPLTVGSVTVDGVQIGIESDSTIFLSVSGVGVTEQQVATQETLWLGYGVGLVRSEISGDFGVTTMVLKSHYIP